eukprot:scaffold259889_cov24-Tisochrysis_lutea.AAC.2
MAVAGATMLVGTCTVSAASARTEASFVKKPCVSSNKEATSSLGAPLWGMPRALPSEASEVSMHDAVPSAISRLEASVGALAATTSAVSCKHMV